MHEIVRNIARTLSPSIRSYPSFDGIPFREKGRDPIAVIHPEKLKWGEPYPCAQGQCRSFSLILRISVLLPMHGDAALAGRIFAGLIEPHLAAFSLDPVECDEPGTDLHTDRLQCSRRYVLTGVRMTGTQEDPGTEEETGADASANSAATPETEESA